MIRLPDSQEGVSCEVKESEARKQSEATWSKVLDCSHRHDGNADRLLPSQESQHRLGKSATRRRCRGPDHNSRSRSTFPPALSNQSCSPFKRLRVFRSSFPMTRCARFPRLACRAVILPNRRCARSCAAPESAIDSAISKPSYSKSTPALNRLKSETNQESFSLPPNTPSHCSTRRKQSPSSRKK